MSLSDVYSGALSALNAARTAMLSPDWTGTGPDAAKALADVQQAILNLSNQNLSDIASAMQANEKDLTAATVALTAALTDISKAENIISAVSSIISVVGKIVPLL